MTGISKMKKLLLCLCCLFLTQTLFAIYFKHLGMQDGLSQVSVMSIYQDKLGRMWFGTREGISLYDGESMRIYKEWREMEKDNIIGTLLGHPCDFIVGNKNGDVFFRTSESMLKYDIHQEDFHLISKKAHAITSFHGEIWVAYENTIYKYDETGDSLSVFLETTLPRISCLQISENKIWIGTYNGLYMSDSRGQIRCILEETEIYRLFEDSSKELWIGSATEGVYRVKSDGDILHYYDSAPDNYRIRCNQIREFAEDKFGNIWFGTFLGLYQYNPKIDHFIFFEHDDLPGSLSHSSVYSLYIDKQSTIWVGTYYGGVSYFNQEKDIFSYYKANSSRNDCLNHPFVGHMTEDNKGNIWICTEGGGLNFFDRQTLTFKHFKGGKNNTILQNNLKNISYDQKRNRVYIGTHLGGLSRYDITTATFHNYLHKYQEEEEEELKYTMPDNIIFHTMIYNDKLYVSARNGTFVMDMDTDKFKWIYRNAQNFTIDSKGYLWIIIGRELIKTKLDNPNDTQTYILSMYNIHFEPKRLIETRDGKLFFVTLGAGVYQYNEEIDSFIHYSKGNGHLLSDYCYNIAETNDGELLITSDKGITFFNPTTKTSKFTTVGDNLPITSITDGCGILVCKNKELFIGGTDGLTSFWRDRLDEPEKEYSLYFSELYIHNARVYPEKEGKLLSTAFPFNKSIKLNYKQNNIIVNFATTNYINIQKNNNFEYRLEGFDTNWIPVSLKSIYYTNLSPGKYNLIVRDKKGSLESSIKREISLAIEVTSPWYNRLWAWVMYILIIGVITHMTIRTTNARKELKRSLKKEKEEKERIEELNQVKLQFFTNISHEFRTPLTLIISQIDLLLQSSSLSSGIYNKVVKIRKNANQMRNMISELLEFRKIEQNHVSLHISKQDIVAFLKDIYYSYHELSILQKTSFHFNHNKKEILLWFDPVQLQIVFNNLLSNAFKYTNNGDSVDIYVDEYKENVFIKIIDSGIGLSPAETSHIFDYFYQSAKGYNFSNSKPGTGIGLSLSKNIVDLHHGEIVVKSQLDYGSIFTVRLLKGKSHFEQDDNCIIQEKAEVPTIEKHNPHTTSYNESEEFKDSFYSIEKGSKYTILIVEDNHELLQTLIALFKPFYNIIAATNGKEALLLAEEKIPDIIVSDIMMPLMNGTEMCMKIKNNINLCHIPVILLTALGTVEYNIEGLRLGADDYISKPFNANILLMRCNTLINNRILIKNKFSQQYDFNIQLLAVSPLDQKLMTRVHEIIDYHIDNPDFNINVFVNELGMGRSSLFTKFKALTGMTPNEFIQTQRIKRAAILLKTHPNMRIGEISDQLGFVSNAYFTRCFKAQFGVSPLQYKKGNLS